jgi:adenylate kinase family enzyme
MKVFTFIGAPSTGKGSFGKAIVNKAVGWIHFSLGHYMREEIVKKSPLGLAIQSSISQGHLVPDDLANDLAFKILKEYQAEKVPAVILG